MKRHLPVVLMLACAAVLALGVTQLFKLRFEAGDVYPEYSSLRVDPLGAMALYEGLAQTPGITVRRDYSAANQLPEGRNTTYLHLATTTYDWDWLPDETWKEIDGFMAGGGRLAITFFPETSRPFRFPGALRGTNTVSSKKSAPSGGRRAKRKAMRDEGDLQAGKSLAEHWGVEFGYAALSQGDADVYEPARVLNKTTLPLPPALDWHSATVFTNLDQSWRVIYARGTNPVVVERRFGSGSVVMATDSYFISNEAMRRDRHADLLAWLVGPNRRVIFDEAHFGIVDTSGVAMLMRKYRLHGLAAGLLLLAGLFIWKNSVSFVPPHAEESRQPHVAGKDASAGFVNLLRRNVPARDLLNVCFAEWTRLLTRGSVHSIARVDQAQALIEAENARPPGVQDPVGAYKRICEVLKKPAVMRG